jgi:O-antigen/teichoic acid export membrane protein
LPDHDAVLAVGPVPVRAQGRFATGILFTAGSQGINAVAGALATYAVARSLGPAGTGAYTAASTLLAMLLPLSVLGLNVGIAYYVSQGRWSPFDALTDIGFASLFLGAAAGLVGIAAWAIVPDAFRGLDLGLVALVVVSLPAALYWGLAACVALAVGRYPASGAPAAGCAILTLGLTIALTVADGVSGSVIAIAAGQLTTATGMLIWSIRRRDEPGWPPRDRTSSRSYRLLRATRFGFPVYMSQALQVLNNRLDLFLVIGFAGAAAGGRYGVALSLTAALLLVPRAVSMVLMPRLAQRSGGVDAEAGRRLTERRAIRHVVILTTLAGLGLLLFLVLLVPLLYGSAFEQTVTLGLILVPGAAALGLAETLSASVVARGHNQCARVVAVAVTPVTVLLYVAVIPILHATGAAVASSVSYMFTFAMWAHFYRRHVDPKLARTMTPSLAEIRDYRQSLAWTRQAFSRRAHVRRRAG